LFSTVAAWELSGSNQSRVEYRSGNWVIYRLLPSGATPDRRYRPAGRYDDLTRGIRMNGLWIRDKQFTDSYRGTLMYCDEPLCQAEFDFEGSAITLLHTRAFNRGQAEILIDDSPVATLDAYSPQLQWQQRARYAAASPGHHTLTIRVLGSHSAASTGDFIDIDGFIVE
jgi:hypothetical protein